MDISFLVAGYPIPVVDGWVSVRALCRALNLDASRQREKAAKVFQVRTLKIPRPEASGRVALYKQTCIRLEDAKQFVESQGLWTRGPYQKDDLDF